MAVGIPNKFFKTATQTVTASIAPVLATGLTIPIAANQTMHIRWHLTFSVGAAGGCRFLVNVPAGGVTFNNDIVLNNTVAPAVSPFTQPTAVAFANALANAGTHFIEMESHIVNGTTAGSVFLSFAQNTSDATGIVLFIGSWMETTTF